jgi:hypothetical protein
VQRPKGPGDKVLNSEYYIKAIDPDNSITYPVHQVHCLKRFGQMAGRGTFYSNRDIDLDEYKETGFSIMIGDKCEIPFIMLEKKVSYLQNLNVKTIEVWKYYFKAYFEVEVEKEMSFEF